MSSCSSCNSPTQAFQAQTAQSYVKQQLSNLQNPAKQPASGNQPLNTSGDLGRNLNVTA